MDKQAIFHRTKSSYAYAFDFETVHLKVRSKKDDLTAVNLWVDDEPSWVEETPGNWVWNKKEIPMAKIFSTRLYDYWFVAYKPKDYKMRYGFIVEDQFEKLVFAERGFFTVDDKFFKNDINSYFSFPYIHKNDIFTAPSWVKDTVWYQIFPDRFKNGDRSNDSAQVLPWGEKKDLGQYSSYGGDIRGIIDKLDYLKELGINGIYLTPVFKAPTSHKYDTQDYFEIDPSFGTKEELRELVDKAHRRGIRIMLDAVFNHIGETSYQFQDAIENGRNSKFYQWFYFEENGDYRNFTPNMPKLRTTNPEVKKYLLSVAKYWIQEIDIDGWRLDVANEIDHEFWREFRQTVKKMKADVYICGEIWHDSQAWLNGDQFDGVMNYPLAKPIQEWLATERIDGIEFKEEFVHALMRYGENQNLGMMTLLDSYDTTRITSWASKNHQKTDMCFVMLITVPGSICFYYGSEIYMPGLEDPDNRRCMQWEDVITKTHLSQFIQLRKEYPEIGSHGKYH